MAAIIIHWEWRKNKNQKKLLLNIKELLSQIV